MGKSKLNPIIEQEFQKLMEKQPDGRLHPEAIVNAAEAPSHPLHEYFTWENTEAARKWRLQEATMLIQSFVVNYEAMNITVRALTSLEMDRKNGGGFRWTLQVAENPALRPQLVETAVKELQAIKKRYAHLTELVDVWRSVDRAREFVYEPPSVKAK